MHLIDIHNSCGRGCLWASRFLVGFWLGSSSLNVLFVPVWVFSKCSSFLPQSTNMNTGLAGRAKLRVRVQISDGCVQWWDQSWVFSSDPDNKSWQLTGTGWMAGWAFTSSGKHVHLFWQQQYEINIVSSKATPTAWRYSIIIPEMLNLTRWMPNIYLQLFPRKCISFLWICKSANKAAERQYCCNWYMK